MGHLGCSSQGPPKAPPPRGWTQGEEHPPHPQPALLIPCPWPLGALAQHLAHTEAPWLLCPTHSPRHLPRTPQAPGRLHLPRVCWEPALSPPCGCRPSPGCWPRVPSSSIVPPRSGTSGSTSTGTCTAGPSSPPCPLSLLLSQWLPIP